MAQCGLDITRKRILKKGAVPTLFPKSFHTPSKDLTATYGRETAAKRPREAFQKREKARVGSTCLYTIIYVDGVYILQ
jgi:hypothetical protein